MFRALFESVASVLAGRSSRWGRVRRDHLDGEPVCQVCGTDENLQVHHCTPVGHGGDELDSANLITLCGPPRNCHYAIGHAWDTKKYRPNVKRLARIIREWEVRE
jgi:5-methylcytosine-specific restriction endonuclease McrA